jgi:hypothetical protein
MLSAVRYLFEHRAWPQAEFFDIEDMVILKIDAV